MSGQDTSVKVLMLSENDMIKSGVLDMAKCIGVCEDVFMLMTKNDYILGGPKGHEHGQMLFFPDEPKAPNMPTTGPDRRFMSMCSYVGGKYHTCGMKWYGSNVQNAQKGLPRSVLTLTLNYAESGLPYAIMQANLLNGTRTGAVPAVGAKYLARKNSKIHGFIGSGVIARAALRAMMITVPSLEEALVYDIAKDRAEKWISEQKAEFPNLKFTIAGSIEEVARNADILTVATSGKIFPRVETEWLKPGCFFNMTSAVDMDADAWNKHTIVADDWGMHEAIMEDGLESPKGIDAIGIISPSLYILKAVVEKKYDPKNVKEFVDILAKKIPARESEDEVIFFITTGVQITDTAWGWTLHEEAVKQGLGTEFKFFDEAHWR